MLIISYCSILFGMLSAWHVFLNLVLKIKPKKKRERGIERKWREERKRREERRKDKGKERKERMKKIGLISINPLNYKIIFNFILREMRLTCPFCTLASMDIVHHDEERKEILFAMCLAE